MLRCHDVQHVVMKTNQDFMVVMQLLASIASATHHHCQLPSGPLWTTMPTWNLDIFQVSHLL